MQRMNSKPNNNHNRLSALAGQAKEALAPKANFSPTPTTRNGNGFHRGDGKPTDGPSQWLLIPGAKLPPRAFEMHEKERHRFHTIARSLPLEPTAVDEIQRIGGHFFDATYGAEGIKFQHEIAAGRLEQGRFTAEKARLETDIQVTNADLTDIPPTTEQEQAEPRLPMWFSAKWWGFALCVALLCISSGAAIVQIANLYNPTLQSMLLSTIAASPWVLAAVAVEIFLLLTIRAESLKVAWALRAALLVLIVGILLWLGGLFPLAAPLSVGQSLLLPDRRWAVAGQLLCELAVSFLLLSGMLKLLSHQRVTIPNENRRRISNHVADLSGELANVHKELANVLTELAKPEGNYTEWNNSRTAFVEEGVTIVKLRHAAGRAEEEARRQSAASRAENERLLQQFSP